MSVGEGEGEPPDNVLAFPGPRDLDPESAVDAVEALLFAAGDVVTDKEIAEALELEPGVVRDALVALRDREGGGLRVVEVARGWQMRSDARFAEPIRRLRGGRPQVMSKAALEALAIVAYRQPVTRAEIDELRGVNSGGVLKALLDKGYVKVAGRRDEPGRPLEYATTPLFLEMFELSGLEALPTLAEREAFDDEGSLDEVDDDGFSGELGAEEHESGLSNDVEPE